MTVLAIAKHLAAYRAIGVPGARVLGWVGANHRRGRMLELCGYVPDTIVVRVPERIRAGARFRMTSADQTDQIACRLWINGWGGFEKPLPDLFGACARDSNTIVDIGANSGLYAILAAAISPKATVYAFEPLPAALHVMRQNLALNSFFQRINIVECAVADMSGEAEFFVPAGNETLLEMSASLNSEFRPKHAEVLNVRMVTIDQYVLDHSISRIDLMKIDVESQEHRVLAGATGVLEHHRPIVFLEVLPGASVDELERIRRAHRYQSILCRPSDVRRVDAIAVDPQATNQVLCPDEKLMQFMKSAKTLGL